MLTNAENQARWRQRHPEQHLANDRRWRARHPEQNQANHRRDYGKRLSQSNAEYDYLFLIQGGVCIGCGLASDKRLEMDHDHSCCSHRGRTKLCGRCTRGLLCRSCNAKDVLAITT